MSVQRVDPGSIPELISMAVGQRLEEMLSGWREKYPEVRVFPGIAHGHPPGCWPARPRADLTVIGRRTRPSIGSVRNVVLSHAHGPIAVVPSAQP